MAKQANKAEQIYQYLQSCWQDKQCIPTQREIARDCGVSSSKVGNYLSQLEAQGRIVRVPYQARGIRLVESEPQDNETAETVYDYLQEVIAEGESPSQTEIADACYISRGSVHRALIWLEAQGRIKRGKGQRSIQLVDS